MNEALGTDGGLELPLFEPLTVYLLGLSESQDLLTAIGNRFLIGCNEVGRRYGSLVGLGGEDDAARSAGRY